MKSEQVLIRNCKSYKDKEHKKIFHLLLKDGKIKEILEDEKGIEIPVVIDAKGLYAIPGLIDVHIQGAGGFDILDSTEEANIQISKSLAELGTTSYLATTIVKPTENNQHLKVANKFVGNNFYGAASLGFHLEGPFINPIKKGGIDAKSIYPSSEEKFKELVDLLNDDLKMMTIAPELDGNLRIIKKLKERNIIASFGHSDANFDETINGLKAGISHATHLFNAMPAIHHRTPGPIPAIFSNSDIAVQIISDGHHLHPSIVNLIYKSIGIDRCICITDGVQAMGLPEGEYTYNNKKYISKDGAAKYFDGTLIGSTMSLMMIVKKFKEFTGCSFEEAINTATKNPAKLLGVEKTIGAIETGKDADILLIDDDLNIHNVIIKGKKFK